MTFLRLLCVVALTTLLCHQGTAQSTTTKRSPDGTQSGTIDLAEDGSQGTVTSLSTGNRRASASSTLVIGPGSAQGSFTAEGDSQTVSESASVRRDGEKSTSTPTSVPVPVPAPAKQEETPEGKPNPAAQETTNQTTEQEEPVAIEGQSVPQDKEESKKAPAAPVPSTTTTVIPSSGTQQPKKFQKVCVVNDEAQFHRELAKGHEVTLVQAIQGGQIRVVTALELPHASTRSSIITDYIPEQIKERCGVSYADLGLEERDGDGFSSIVGSTSRVQVGSSPGLDSAVSTADRIRANVFRSLCMQDFFRNFALFEECKKYASEGPIEGPIIKLPY